MTESANFRPNLQNVPSIFEISAAESLDDLIYPALSKIFDYFGLRLDFNLWGKVRVREELSPLLTWILQYIYLKNRGASFGESFYGLQRTLTASGEILTQRHRFLSATFLAFVPFIERKLQRRSEQHESTSKIEKVVLRLFHVYNVAKAIQLLLYLIKYANNHTPLFRVLGLTLRYPAGAEFNRKGDIFIKVLELFAFFLQFMQWWYNNNKGRKIGGGSFVRPAAPKKRIPEYQSVKDGQCPICLMPFESPTACAVSGYVYCWKCIVTYLKTHKKCPMSGYGITFDDLVRVYDNKT